MIRLICWIEGIFETVTMPLFWRSLLNGPPVIVSGHLWPLENPEWSEPRPSPDPDWPGMVEYEIARCQRCDADLGGGWRRIYGLIPGSEP